MSRKLLGGVEIGGAKMVCAVDDDLLVIPELGNQSGIVGALAMASSA